MIFNRSGQKPERVMLRQLPRKTKGFAPTIAVTARASEREVEDGDADFRLLLHAHLLDVTLGIHGAHFHRG